MAALILATRDVLRTRMALTAAECEATERGRPIPSAGERFVGVYDGSWSARSDWCLDEYFGVTVAVSVRCQRVPEDRRGPALMYEMAFGAGLARLAEWVRAVVHMSYTINDAANAYIGPNFNGFVEPLQLAGPGRVRYESGEWSEDEEEPMDWLVIDVPFGGARRLQAVEHQADEFFIVSPTGLSDEQANPMNDDTGNTLTGN